MRRLWGVIVAMALLTLSCATGGDGVTERSSAPPGHAATPTTTDAAPSKVAAPDADEGDDAPASGSAATAGQRSNEPDLDPVPVGIPRSVRQASPPAASAPSGPQATGRIDIPAIGLSHATYEGIDLAVINYGPSWWPGTARPGFAGNTVFPGHRTTYSRPFWDLDRLVPGNEVIFTTGHGRFTYRVTEVFVVSATDTWIVEPTNKATFTLFACHPKGSARQRVVAKGELVSAPATTTTTTKPPPTTTSTTTTTEPDNPGLVGRLLGRD